MDRKRLEIFESFEEENEAEYRRHAKMMPEERMQELAELRARQWGEDWGKKPIKKVATWEWVDW